MKLNTRLISVTLLVIGIIVILLTVPQIFGDREVAMLDLWSIEHFFFGVVLAAVFKLVFPKLSVKTILAIVLAIAVGWEVMEYAMELGMFGNYISDWKKGHEHWSNRMIADPLLVLLGGYLQMQRPKTWKWVIVPFVAWGLLNYLSPDSMYVQRVILEALPL